MKEAVHSSAANSGVRRYIVRKPGRALATDISCCWSRLSTSSKNQVSRCFAKVCFCVSWSSSRVLVPTDTTTILSDLASIWDMAVGGNSRHRAMPSLLTKGHILGV